jgi:hypothetical protein
MSNKTSRKQSDAEKIEAALTEAERCVVDALTYLDLVTGVNPTGAKLSNYKKARKANLICEDLIYKARRDLRNLRWCES